MYIGEGYKWNDSEPAGFYRNFGTRGYDYGRGASYSPFDNGTIITGSQQPVTVNKIYGLLKQTKEGFQHGINLSVEIMTTRDMM